MARARRDVPDNPPRVADDVCRREDIRVTCRGEVRQLAHVTHGPGAIDASRSQREVHSNPQVP